MPALNGSLLSSKYFTPVICLTLLAGNCHTDSSVEITYHNSQTRHYLSKDTNLATEITLLSGKWGDTEMLERLLLAATVTFLLNLFSGVKVPYSPQSESELHRQPTAPQNAIVQPSAQRSQMSLSFEPANR
ncbi:MAG: hypothetical protein KME19_25585 [Microcoleus vaginatus WJT46-NPBG5]|nr:hypothetical protein [Microcoleus vaginatus WJT46-NPBG5]